MRKSIFKACNLTEGCIWKTILTFALPVFLSYLLQNMYGIADAVICGQTLSSYEVAGVNDTGSISFLILQFAFGCTAGMSTLLAANAGKNDGDGVRKAFATQIKLSLAICVVLTAAGLLSLDLLLKTIGIEKSAENTNNLLYTAAHSYMTVIIAGSFAQYFYNLICSTLRSLGDSLSPLIFLAVSSALNIGLDLLFISAFGMGVTGAALATVIAQAVSAAGCFAYSLVRYPQLRVKLCDFRLDFKADLKYLAQGVPLGLQFSILAFGLIALANGVVSFDKTPDGVIVEGAPAQNGFAAANKVFNLLAMAPNALGTAFISFVSQNDGAGKPERIKKGYVQTVIIMLIIFVISAGLGFLLGINGAYQYVFLSRDKISQASVNYGAIFLLSHLPTMFLLGFLVISRNTVQGLKKPLFPFLAGVLELVSRILICIFVPALVNGAPLDCNASPYAFFALCTADAGAWLAADLILVPAVICFVFGKKRKPELTDLTENKGESEQPAANR